MTPQEFSDYFFAFPTMGDAFALYTAGFLMVMFPWLVAFGGSRIIKAMDLFKGN